MAADFGIATKIVSCLGYTGGDADPLEQAAHDAQPTFRWAKLGFVHWSDARRSDLPPTFLEIALATVASVVNRGVYWCS
jgi:hypothetical protein